ncbi:MAG TPA: choice-of-anchor D domain-containing protein [Candidatus Binataceae bacterium]|nr:choice-of-anchor D domain-containing protein [Candidatus Binataceae bacterium]
MSRIITGVTWRGLLRIAAAIGYATLLLTSLFGFSTSRAQTATPTGTPTTVGSKLIIKPSILKFGFETVLPPDGAASAPKSIILSVAKNQPAPVTIEQPLMVSDSNATPAEFIVQSNMCSVIAPGGSCRVPIVFQPSGTRVRSALLLITSNAANGVQSVSLIGHGKQGTLSISPRTLSFPLGIVGALPSASKPVTLTNRNSVQLTINSISSSNSDAFPITNGCPNVLQPGASCTVSASFSAQRNGQNRGSIDVGDNAGGPDRVLLVGSGRGGPTKVPTATATATRRATPAPTPVASFPMRAFPVMH